MSTKANPASEPSKPRVKVPAAKQTVAKAPAKVVAKAATKVPTKASKASKPENVEKVEKKAKADKLVRDSFTMPQADFDLIGSIKQRALGFQRPTKKSEVLRAGLKALSAMSEAQLKHVLQGLAVLKTGRPKKG